MAGELLVSTAVMGGLIVLVTLWVTLSPRWTGAPVRTTLAENEGDRLGRGSGGVLSQPAVWTVGFAVVVVGIIVAIVGFGTGALGGMVSPTVALIGGLGALLVGYLVYGVYVAAAAKGHPKSIAAGEAAAVAGALFLVAIVAQLFGI
jgi:hypothetical protein